MISETLKDLRFAYFISLVKIRQKSEKSKDIAKQFQIIRYQLS